MRWRASARCRQGTKSKRQCTGIRTTKLERETASQGEKVGAAARNSLHCAEEVRQRRSPWRDALASKCPVQAGHKEQETMHRHSNHQAGARNSFARRESRSCCKK